MIWTSSGHSVKIAETDNDRSSHGAIVTRNYLKTTKTESLGFISMKRHPNEFTSFLLI